MSTADLLPGVIRDKLLSMDRQQRELAIVRGGGQFLLLGCGLLAVCLVTDIFVNLSASVRAVELAGLAVLLAGAGWWWLIRPWNQRRTWVELAAAVERNHPELSERLTTLVELNSDSVPTGSPLMRELLTRQTVKAVSQVDFTEVLPAGKAFQRGAIGLVALAFLLFPFLIPGGRYALSWNRLLLPWGNYDWGTRFAFQVPEGDRVVARGSDVTLRAEPERAADAELKQLSTALHWVDATGRSFQRSMKWNEEAGAFEVTLPRVEQSFRYHVASRKAVSKDYHITAADRPRVTAWKIGVQPPGYTGLPAETRDAVVGELRVPERSKLSFQWQFAEPVVSPLLIWPERVREHAPDGGEETGQPVTQPREIALTLAADRLSARAEVIATANGHFDLKLLSDLGLENEPVPHELQIISDQRPEISVERQDVVAAAGPADLLPIPFQAADDYGLSAVELHWQTSAGREGQLSQPAEALGNQRLETSWDFDLATTGAASGQTLTIRLRAVDNCPMPGPQEAWSEGVTVTISAEADSPEAQQLASAQERLEHELNELQEAIAHQKQAVNTEHGETAREAVKGGKPPENQAELEKLAARQAELRDQLESLKEELAQRPFLDKVAQDHLPQVERKLAEAEQSLAQAAEQPEARDQIEQLSQSLDQLGQAEDELEKLKQEARALAALEQELAELGRLSRQAEKLAREAQQLERQAAANEQPNSRPGDDSASPAQDARPEGDRPPARQDPGEQVASKTAEPGTDSRSTDPAEIQQELERLEQETAELAEQLDELLRRRPELLEAARQHELDRLAQLAELAERLAQPQQQLAEALSREADTNRNRPDRNEATENGTESGNEPSSSDERRNAAAAPTEEAMTNEPGAASPEGDDRPASEPGESPADSSDETETGSSPGENSPNPQTANRPDPNRGDRPAQPDAATRGEGEEPAAGQNGASEPSESAGGADQEREMEAAGADSESGPPETSGSESAAGETPGSERENPAGQDDAGHPQDENAAGNESPAPLAERISQAVRQQQQLAREAARQQREAAEQSGAGPAEQSGASPEQTGERGGNAPQESEANNSPPPNSAAPRNGDRTERSQADPDSSAAENGDAGNAGASPNRAESSRERGSSPPQQEFAERSQEAAQAAQAGDLQRAAEASEQAAEAAQAAAQQAESSPSGNSPGSPPAGAPNGNAAAEEERQRAAQLAERQQELAEEFRQLAESSPARQAAQQQSQRQLSQAAQSLTESLQQATERLSQEPLNLPESGRNAEQAAQSARAANQAMNAATQSMQRGSSSRASEQADAAREQLQQAAEQAAQAASQPTESSPASERIPGPTASQVAQAANQLRSARERLAQAQASRSGQEASAGSPEGKSPGENAAPSEAAADSESSPNSNGTPAEGSPSGNPADKGAASSKGSSAQGTSPEGSTSPEGNGEVGESSAGTDGPPGRNPQASGTGRSRSGNSQGEPSADGDTPSGNEGSAEGGREPANTGNERSASGNSQNGSGNEQDGRGEGQPGNQASPLSRTAQTLRQAAQSLSNASRNGRPGSPGNSRSSAKGGPSGSRNSRQSGESAMAQQPGANSQGTPGEPSASSDPSEGFAEFGGGGAGEAGDLDPLETGAKVKPGSRNWGRLPKHLQSEILQGSTKKPHPEYSRQIKRYFEQIAQPAEKQARP